MQQTEYVIPRHHSVSHGYGEAPEANGWIWAMFTSSSNSAHPLQKSTIIRGNVLLGRPSLFGDEDNTGI